MLAIPVVQLCSDCDGQPYTGRGKAYVPSGQSSGTAHRTILTVIHTIVCFDVILNIRYDF